MGDVGNFSSNHVLTERVLKSVGFGESQLKENERPRTYLIMQVRLGTASGTTDQEHVHSSVQ